MKKIITYRIDLLEPTLVTALEGDPNEGKAFDYLPGSVLRGAVIGKYLRHNNLRELDAAAANVRRLFFDGTTLYLNGYLVNQQDRRTLPTPLSWQCEKGNENNILDFAIETPTEGETKQWKGIGEPFCSLVESDEEVQKVHLFKPERHLAVHTARTRRFGRAMPGEKIDPSKGDLQGAVYRYDALEAGQVFEAVIICNDEDAETLRLLLDGEVTLGGSRSGGYGRARLKVAKPKTAENWREVEGNLNADVDDKLIITFLSDTLLRDKNGQFVVDPSVVTHVLSQYLGVSLGLERAFLRGEVIGGFNRKWGLPLPQALAVRMGSVFVYHTPTSDIRIKLTDLEIAGIGERRAEGFGRVAVNWQTEVELKREGNDTSSIPRGQIDITDATSLELAKRMVERLLRKRLDEELLKLSEATNIQSPPSNAQIYRLRNILRDELTKEKPSLERIREFLKRIEERSAARRQFERARVGNYSLIQWLKDKLKKMEEGKWDPLAGSSYQRELRVGNIKAALTEEMRTEYALRFIDAVFARAIKKEKKEG